MVKDKFQQSAWSSDGNILVRDVRDNKNRINTVEDLTKFWNSNEEAQTTDSYFSVFTDQVVQIWA